MRVGWCVSAALLPLLTGSGAGCTKVSISDVAASFEVADAAWFEAEETLFIFYEISAEQGIGDPSVVELTYATDDQRVDWTPLSEFAPIHTHEPVDCGPQALCGSWSLHVPIEPREVSLRMRYHEDGELALDSDTVYNVIDIGPAHTHRSMVVYGVFDETNQWIQWRGRHTFPTLRNERVEELGLRRWFQVGDQAYGTALTPAATVNPYGYGLDCPDDFLAADVGEVTTLERAVFNDVALPLDASSASAVCALSTVSDATGAFSTDALAQKNPEVRPAFPLLRSPIGNATPLEFFLAPCDRVIDAEHEEMQRQRLLVEDVPTYCTDDWEDDEWEDELVTALVAAVEAERDRGKDMVLVIGLHRDEQGVALNVQEALARVVPEERHRTSPRLAGAFVFDSDIEGLIVTELESSTLWCPADAGDGASGRTCAISPDNPGLELGPFEFGSLPILPSRDLYLEFIETYSVRQAGSVESYEFLTPEFAATTDHIDLGAFGAITFLNDELISADGDDAFSWCVPSDPPQVYWRSDFLVSDNFALALANGCATGAFDEEFCSLASLGVMGIEWLPWWHSTFFEETYELGLYWDFTFLLQMKYEAFTAGAVSAFQFSVPFGLGFDGEAYYGGYTWVADEFSLEDALTQCTRFCENPTFDSAAVYHVTDPFRPTYMTSCYLPDLPEPGNDGFPRDP
jgi:hypothetical protein